MYPVSAFKTFASQEQIEGLNGGIDVTVFTALRLMSLKLFILYVVSK